MNHIKNGRENGKGKKNITDKDHDKFTKKAIQEYLKIMLFESIRLVENIKKICKDE